MDAPQRRWLPWCLFGALVAGLATMVGLNVWNTRRLLTQDKLQAAQRLWQQAGVKDYDITISVTGRTSARYHLQVRDGEVATATQNDQPFLDANGKPDKRRAYYWTVAGLFEVLETELANAAKPDAPPCYSQVEFDPTDGHPRTFLRSSSGQTTLIEVNLQRQ